MRAIVQRRFGPPSELRVEAVPDLRPAEGQVRIRVRSAGIHIIDASVRAGRQSGAFPLPELPTTPGREVAGVVDAVGPGVVDDWLGRRVVAHLGMANGGYAELAVADVTALHEIPAGLDADAAVALIGTGRTTVAILEVAALTADDVALVTAAAGGIGSLLIQAVRNTGGTVIALAGGAKKVALAAELGADVAVDYTRDGWTDEVRGGLNGRAVTVAFDGVGGDISRRVLDLLGVGGRLVLYGWSSGTPLELSAVDLAQRSLTVTAAIGPRILQRPGGMQPLEEAALAEAAAGRWRPLVGQTFALEDAPAAHAAIEARATVGKTVLHPQVAERTGT